MEKAGALASRVIPFEPAKSELLHTARVAADM
jgi:hypothetical protein